MKHRALLGALVAIMMTTAPFEFVAPAEAEDLTPEQQQAVEEAVQKYLQERGLLEEGQPAVAAPPVRTAPGGEAEGKRLEKLAEPRGPGKKYGSTMEGSGKLIYARPFVSSPKAILGGYMDIEYINRDDQGDNSTFDQHRLVPFIYGDVSDHVKFAAEIEIEHGQDVRVEFATIDYLVNEPVNLRAGIVLLPLGKFNLLHDSPLRDLTERPIVDRKIIPSTLHQPGAGLYGTFYPTELSQLNYEFYVTSGFTNAFGGEDNPENISRINEVNGIRKARTNNTEFDNNNDKAVVGRLSFSPFLGVEIGGSGFLGAYDRKGNKDLAIWALDWTLQRGPFELIGESAWAYIEDNNVNQDKTLNGNPQRMTGYYVQGNYHFLPQWLTRLAPNHFRQDISTFTAVVRWEDVNLGQDIDNTEPGKRGRRQRLTLGLNFRPTEDTVMKFDWQYSPQELKDNDTDRINDTAFLASWATYF